MDLSLLLTENNAQAGYRLDYLEVFNWGTFDAGANGRVWELTPNGQNSLLTGKNGSGKTTLVHALLVLMVKNYSAHFSQSEKDEKKERDERSYMDGAYGKVKDEQENVKKQLLRPNKNHYSVLLAHFSNAERGGVTLAQVRYYGSSGQLNKEFIFSKMPLTIAGQFRELDGKGMWKRQLKKDYKIEFFDSFEKYYNRFALEFGLKEKAMALFAKTIGIKVLGNLNEFIRENMLEATGADEQFIKLRDSYETLMSIYADIEKSEKKLELLEPIAQSLRGYDELSDKWGNLTIIKENITAFFAARKLKLLHAETERKTKEKEAKEAQLKQMDDDLQQLRDELRDLYVAKSKNDIEQRVKDLRASLDSLNRDKVRKEKEAQKYDALAQKLNLPNKLKTNGLNLFEQNWQDATELKVQIGENYDAIIRRIANLDIEKSNFQREYAENDTKLKYLRKNQTRITGVTAEIREEIIKNALLGQVTKAQLPFAAELIKLKASEKKWELAIERLLRNFGLCLLVSEEHYERVNRYVRDNHIKGYLVYHRIFPQNQAAPLTRPQTVMTKLELKKDTYFTNWLENQLVKSFDYVCTEHESEFYQANKAITSSGLIKSGSRHEKDDRKKQNEFILGWENEADIQALQIILMQIEDNIKQFDSNKKELLKMKADFEDKKEAVNQFLTFADFDTINYHQELEAWTSKKAEHDTLLQSSAAQALKDLQSRINILEESIITAKSKERDDIIAAKNRIIDTLERFGIQKNNCDIELAKPENKEFMRYEAYLLPETKAYRLSLDTIDQDLESARKKSEANIRVHNLELSKKKQEIEDFMKTFIRPRSQEIQAKFPTWGTETSDFVDKIEHRSTYMELYQQLKADNLPSYKKRFKEKVDQDIITQITAFKTFLEKKQEEIKEKIDDELNPSLRLIDYQANPTTYIELIWSERNLDIKKIPDFRKTLQNIISTYGQERHEAFEKRGNVIAYQNTFDMIKKMITELNENEWDRKRVIDVRNWLSFGARERYRQDDTEKRYYDSSAGLSKGQKVKLFYTILSSAIANQFNIHLGAVQNKSFRFIVIDEAFSDVDPENAKYAMDLFNILHLQVMIVTPLDKINIVESYINTVHYVDNPDNCNSKVYNLTLQDYASRKQKIE